MALGFPTDPPPVNGQTYRPPGSTKTYVWSSSQGAWLIYTSESTSTSIIAPSIIVNTTTNAISTETGALIVAGGVGIGKDLYVGGLIYSNGVPSLTTASFNISDGPDGGVDINISHIVDVLSGTSTITINNISTLDTVTGRGNVSTNPIIISNATSSTNVGTGALIVAGGAGIAGRVNTESIQIADAVFDSTNTYVNQIQEYIIDSYLLNKYRSSKYFIQIDEGPGNQSKFHAVEINLTADNDGTPYMTQYGQVTTSGELGTFSAKGESSGDTYLISLTFTPFDVTRSKAIKVLRTAMTSSF